MKSQLGLKSLFRRTDRRTDGYLIHSRLKMRSVHLSWSALRFVLDYGWRITT
ncbi:MAG: hypothetical protein OXM02_00495 [Bacteroidota bacterium]|nr:hypothetical protein [Bacteroidota bacterium]MDE2832983.1 hypothetical protein [Bacteroidota bacterium]MDE2955469.1 hypothetical protein [Bacteroidota bacterium]